MAIIIIMKIMAYVKIMKNSNGRNNNNNGMAN
jgi:hypothetical protein